MAIKQEHYLFDIHVVQVHEQETDTKYWIAKNKQGIKAIANTKGEAMMQLVDKTIRVRLDV